MDIDETLRRLREESTAMHDGPMSDADAHDSLAYVIELLDALDDWLMRGGALPSDWRR